MILEEAIRLNGELLRTGNYDVDAKFTKAIQLGIEALKLTKRLRKEQGNEYLLLLPGETEK